MHAYIDILCVKSMVGGSWDKGCFMAACDLICSALVGLFSAHFCSVYIQKTIHKALNEHFGTRSEYYIHNIFYIGHIHSSKGANK